METISMVKGENVIVVMQQGSKRKKETMEVQHKWRELQYIVNEGIYAYPFMPRETSAIPKHDL